MVIIIDKIFENKNNDLDIDFMKSYFIQKGADEVLTTGNDLKFKSKGIFSYHNLHPFIYIDTGQLKIIKKFEEILLRYEINSLKVYFPPILVTIFSFVIFSNFFFALLFGILSFLILYIIIKVGNKRLLTKMLNKMQ